jgi:hypothetical protein
VRQTGQFDETSKRTVSTVENIAITLIDLGSANSQLVASNDFNTSRSLVRQVCNLDQTKHLEVA